MGLEGKQYRVGLGGLGAIGLKVARALDAGIPGLSLGAVSARDRMAAE
ncbi:MAG: aspartate dehydrogenase, partial [Proteobacteria bacterium]|nr:aspartate dehydrogenase [Pseudomonadota bacterium]